MPSVGKKLHHFVPRFYLKAWASRERVICLQDKKIQLRNLRNVAAENYFYKLVDLSEEDVRFIEKAIIEESPEGLKAYHRQTIAAFMAPFKLKRMINESGRILPEPYAAELDKFILELSENLHCFVEDRFKPILDLLLSGDLGFLQDTERAITFYYGLCVQFTRGNHIRRSRHNMTQEEFDRHMRVSNVLANIIAVNVAHSLFVDRNLYTVLLLENASEVPFVTSDQPIINLSSNPTRFKPPEKFELYYPLSPSKAAMLLEPESVHYPSNLSISAAQAHMYNVRMAACSFRQVFSTSTKELEAIREDIDPYLSCFR